MERNRVIRHVLVGLCAVLMLVTGLPTGTALGQDELFFGDGQSVVIDPPTGVHAVGKCLAWEVEYNLLGGEGPIEVNSLGRLWGAGLGTGLLGGFGGSAAAQFDVPGIDFQISQGAEFNAAECDAPEGVSACFGSGFSLYCETPLDEGGFPILSGMMTVYTYLTAPSAGVTLSALTPFEEGGFETSGPIAATSDLAIFKTADRAESVNVGDVITYTVTVTWDGPQATADAQVIDLYDASSTATASYLGFLSDADQTICGGDPIPDGATSLTCDLTGIANGGSASFSYQVQATSTGDLNNVATVSPAAGSDVVDCDPNNNTAAISLGSTPLPFDVSLDKQIAPSDPNRTADDLAVAFVTTPPTQVAFEIIVTNGGPGVATNVVVTDPQAASLVLNDPTAGSCTGTTCTINTIALGGNQVLTATAPATAAFENTASVSAAGDDNETNNSDSASVEVIDRFDVGVSKTHRVTRLARPSGVGEQVRFFVTVTNNDSVNAAPPVVVTDALPANMTFTTPSGCTQSAGELSCAVPSLPPATGISFVFVGTGTAAPEGLFGYVNEVCVTEDGVSVEITTDQNPADNCDTTAAPYVVDPPFGEKVATPEGILLRWTMVWWNPTLLNAPDVRITDLIAAPGTIVGQPTCTAFGASATTSCGIDNGDTIVWEGTIAPLASASASVDDNRVEISYLINPNTDGPVTNSASLNWDPTVDGAFPAPADGGVPVIVTTTTHTPAAPTTTATAVPVAPTTTATAVPVAPTTTATAVPAATATATVVPDPTATAPAAADPTATATAVPAATTEPNPTATAGPDPTPTIVPNVSPTRPVTTFGAVQAAPVAAPTPIAVPSAGLGSTSASADEVLGTQQLAHTGSDSRSGLDTSLLLTGSGALLLALARLRRRRTR